VNGEIDTLKHAALKRIAAACERIADALEAGNEPRVEVAAAPPEPVATPVATPVSELRAGDTIKVPAAGRWLTAWPEVVGKAGIVERCSDGLAIVHFDLPGRRLNVTIDGESYPVVRVIATRAPGGPR
jgi:hypothetical protein